MYIKGGAYITTQEKNKLLIELLNEREAKNKKNIKELEETKKDILEEITNDSMITDKQYYKSMERVKKINSYINNLKQQNEILEEIKKEAQ